MEGSFAAGEEVGPWKEYHKNGKLASEGSYDRGLEDGIWKNYWDNGQFMQEEVWDKGRLVTTGELTSKTGKKLLRGSMKDGNGTRKSYHDNEKLSAEGPYKNGYPEGKWKYYHPNGMVSAEGEMKEGKREGVWRYFHDTGKLEAEGSYSDDELSGVWKFYEQGVLKEIKNFDVEDDTL
jgi:antitoxin component YwqK of YwqJK toxin-antitoxin module